MVAVIGLFDSYLHTLSLNLPKVLPGDAPWSFTFIHCIVCFHLDKKWKRRKVKKI